MNDLVDMGPAKAPASALDTAKVGQGDIAIKWSDGTEVVLKPTVQAFMTLSRKYDGLQNVIAKLTRLNIETVMDVIEAGANLPSQPKVRQRLLEKIYSAGLTDDTGRIVELTINYVSVLLRGGRPAPQPGEVVAHGEGDSASSLDPR